MNFNIEKISDAFDADIQAKIDNKTKPLGALGQLEPLAKQIAKIQYAQYQSTHADTKFTALPKLSIKQPQLFIFAGDHGVAGEGVSIAPSEVTGQMVANFANGGAAINVFCRQLGWQLSVVDAGILPTSQLPSHPKVLSQRLGDITKPINVAPAMNQAQVNKGFDYSVALMTKSQEQGCNCIAFGEMGIGNTTSASAIMAAVMKLPASECVGRGTGVSDDVVLRKQQVIEQALALHENNLSEPSQILRCLGGFEIVQITGAMLAAAEQKMLVVVDGFICTAAAMLAIELNQNVKDYMVFAHSSGEQGHKKMLAWLGVKPLLNLELRLGEGTGAALALPLIQAAASFYNDMASFEEAEVKNVV